ncbi:PAS domain S-box protein [Vineibacter terrae]|uniref:PAS domain S-box protein n=1 Tax=Vineibacter terrae TaxID=2586908 RepID=UPI002E365AB0|nr:PAS domain S-box protein [Vineibacter terrae]HEX2885317.1 PAS domain S-box protein [Vineibacter terrae]
MNTQSLRRSVAPSAASAAGAGARLTDAAVRAALDEAGVGLLVIDGAGRIVEASAAFQRLMGCDAAALVGRDEMEVVHPDDRAPGGAAGEADRRYVRRDGSAVWTRSSVSVVDDGPDRRRIIVVRDITAQREAEWALRNSEARFRDFIEAAYSLWVETDVELRIVQAALASAASPVRRLDEMVGLPIWQAAGVSDPQLDPTWRDVLTLMQARQPFRDIRYTMVDGQGRTHYRRASGVPVFDEDKRFTGYRCVASDETAEIEARARANATEGLLNLAIEGMSDGFAVFDAEDRLVLMNRRYRESLPPDTDWLHPGLTFEEILRTGVASGHYVEAIGNEESFIAERLREHREGKGARLVRAIGNRWCRARDHRLPDGSTVIIRTDVTDLMERERELQDREEWLRAIAGNLPGFIFRQVVTADGKFGSAYVSDRLMQVIGVPAEEISSGHGTLLDHVHADDRERLVRSLATTAADPGPSLIEVRLIARPGGEVRWLRLHATPKKLPDDALQWDGIGIDITDHKVAEDRLHQALKTEAIGQLTGGVAHDFNNLLTVIAGCAELLNEELPEADHARKELVRSILTASSRGSELTHQLLAFARKQPLQPRAVDVNRLIEELRPLLAGPLGEDIALRFDLRADPTIAHIDAHQLHNAILNLAVNARDAMPGGGRLLIETSNIGLDKRLAAEIADIRPGRYIAIRVVDTGRGMSADIMSRAIEPFFTTKPAGKGTGLGLSMVYGFVKQSGGHMTIDSRPGDGASVCLLLPQAGGADQPGATSVTTAERPRGSETILLVEDDPAVRGTVATLLGNLGYSVIEAASGRAALQIIAGSQPIDLLFTDVVMPGGIDGFQLIDEGRRLRPGLKVLCASGYAESAIERYGRPPPDIELLQKPFRSRELARRIRRVLGQPSAADG